MNSKNALKIAVFGYAQLTKVCIEQMQARNIEVEYFCPQSAKLHYDTLGFNKMGNLNCLLFDTFESEELHSRLKSFAPDLIMSIVMGMKIPDSIIALAKNMAVNFHPADLPRYRSGNAWFWPIRCGEKKSAISIHKLTQEWDKGDIVYKKTFALSPYETHGFYENRITLVGREAINEFLDQVEKDEIQILANKSSNEYYPRVKKKDVVIDWSSSDREIESLVRACNPHFFAQTNILNFPVGIIEVELTQFKSDKPGMLSFKKGDLYISTADRKLKINIINVAGVGAFTGARFIKIFAMQNRGEVFAVNPKMSEEVANSLISEPVKSPE